MKRIPEPEELMESTDQALAYAEADFSASNELFMELFQKLHPNSFAEYAIDLGCGPADIPLRFAKAYPAARQDAIDGSQAMLDLAQQAIGEAGLEKQITLLHKYLPATDLPGNHYMAILSNSLLHHLANPADIWQTVSHCARPGASVLIMDLLRPTNEASVDELVSRYVADAPDILRTDFRNSLFAAYSLEEVEQQLAKAHLSQLKVEQVSDRHLAILGHIQEP